MIGEIDRFLMLQKQLREEIVLGNKTWDDMITLYKEFGMPEMTKDSMRRSFKAYDQYADKGWISQPKNFDIPNREVIEYNAEKNVTVSDKVISLDSNDINNPEVLLRSHGFNPEEFVLISARNSKWQQGTKNGNKTLYSSKISVRPRKAQDITFEDIDKYFESKHDYNGIRITEGNYAEDELSTNDFLEICIQDLHIGLLSYGKETGEDYDVNIARKRLETAVSDIYARCKGRKFKRIVLSLLGDILHVDNQQNTTTKGTRQDVDTRVSKMFDEALNLIIDLIKTLSEIAPVDVINVVGNHDNTLNYMLCKAVEMAYRNDDNITFYNSPNPRKWKKYGNVLIGWAHGDMKTQNVTEWIQSEAYQDWGTTKYRECHMGHLHSTNTVQKIEEGKSGMIVRYLPTLCASSAWEHHKAYSKEPKTVVSFVWNEDTGLRDIWYSNI